ncbi:hypothetical protein BaRGS_00022723 [Batillaria attramentaria]|uniref:Uncharacterized protein n=1 Tax=Batillaria attramentaria TaxID=370345 RepID=A0ABD0KG74_9CAEN
MWRPSSSSSSRVFYVTDSGADKHAKLGVFNKERVKAVPPHVPVINLRAATGWAFNFTNFSCQSQALGPRCQFLNILAKVPMDSGDRPSRKGRAIVWRAKKGEQSLARQKKGRPILLIARNSCGKAGRRGDPWCHHARGGGCCVGHRVCPS